MKRTRNGARLTLYPQVTYFKRYRVAEHKKKETLARLEKEGANRMAVEGPGDTPGSKKI